MAKEMERILAHCNLTWQPEMAAFYEHKGLVRTASVRQVRQPLYTSALARWKKYDRFAAQLEEVTQYDPIIPGT